MKLEDALEITAVKQGSVGGQQVGICRYDVRVRHIPTGITAIVGSERSQARCKLLAIEMIRTAVTQIGFKYDV